MSELREWLSQVIETNETIVPYTSRLYGVFQTIERLDINQSIDIMLKRLEDVYIVHRLSPNDIQTLSHQGNRSRSLLWDNVIFISEKTISEDEIFSDKSSWYMKTLNGIRNCQFNGLTIIHIHSCDIHTNPHTGIDMNPGNSYT